MSKASEKSLSELHSQLATVLKDMLAPRAGEDGLIAPPSPAILSVARQFLKDNHIESDSGAASGPLHGLAGLPVFDDDNVVPLRKQS